LEVRYGPVARLFGAIALIISFTVIVSYQFVAGGFILNVASDGAIPDSVGTIIAATFVILFTALGGMIAIAYTDLPNGIIIVLACLLSVPFVYLAAGGFAEATQVLDAGYFAVVNEQFGAHPSLKVGGYFLATMLLLMGVQSVYQKFYSAKTPKDARKAVILWTIGTVFVETVVVIIAVFAYSKFKGQIDLTIPKEGGKVVLLAAKSLVPAPVGVLLLGAACAVVISTGMNYLLSPTTTIMRDIYQRFLKKEASQSTMVALQKVFIVLLGVIAFFLAIRLTSVLRMAFFAYTIYGVAITPALIAALAWKRVTKAGGLASIISGTVACIVLKVLAEVLPPDKAPDGDPWGIPIIYPALIISLGSLIVVSLLTKKPKPEELEKFFPEKK
jgi:Na+/proline symporter